jgi:hypothetical protein
LPVVFWVITKVFGGNFSATTAGVESVFQAGFVLPTMIELFRGGKQGG